jgi:hypothetical protein
MKIAKQKQKLADAIVGYALAIEAERALCRERLA